MSTNLLTITSGAAVLRLDVIDGKITLYATEGPDGPDVAIPLGEANREELAVALLPAAPDIGVPEQLSPAGHAIASHLVQGFEALGDLFKARPAETDRILRSFVEHVRSWRAHVLREVAA